MEAILRIPFAQKDAAKETARMAGGYLKWNASEDKTWTFIGPKLPKELEIYRQDSTKTRTFLLDVPFQLRASAQEAGASWDPALKATVWRGVTLPKPLESFKSQEYSWERWREDEINGGHDKGQALKDGMTPREHQGVAIKAILASEKAGRSGFLLADDVGTGKTLSALEAILKMKNVHTVLIVCPLAVVAHWRQTILHHGDGGKKFVVINYERLAKLFEAAQDTPPKAKGKKNAVKRKPSKRTLNKRLASKGGFVATFDCVILDESHRLRNVATLRSKFAARMAAEAGFTLWLSATAGQNPLELAYLAPLLAEVTGAKVKDLADFEQWCQARGIGVKRGAYGKWIWDSEGDDAEADLEQIRKLLFCGKTPAGIRRRPEDIAGWPEINRVLFPVAFDPSDRELYLREWSEFRKALSLSRSGKDSKMALVARLRYRQKASLLRVPGTLALAEDLVDNGHQVAVSVEFLETLETMRDGIVAAGHRCSVIHGNMSAAEKERQRVAFQRGDNNVVIYTVAEGISLHAGDAGCKGNSIRRANIIADCRYSAIVQAQIEGRCHRDGQNATVYYVYGEDTVEEGIVQVVTERLRTMKTMIGDDTKTIREIEALLLRKAA